MMHYRSREKHLDAKQGESLVSSSMALSRLIFDIEEYVVLSGLRGELKGFLVLLDKEHERLAAEDAQAKAEPDLYHGIELFTKRWEEGGSYLRSPRQRQAFSETADSFFLDDSEFISASDDLSGNRRLD